MKKIMARDCWVLVLALLVGTLAGCSWMAETLPPEVAEPLLTAGEQAAGAAAEVAEGAAATATEIASRAEDPITGLAGWATAIVLGGVAEVLRRAKKSAQDAKQSAQKAKTDTTKTLADTVKALEIVTKKIRNHDADRVIRDAVAKTMASATEGVKTALEEARP